ncbi:MAG: hypothetical protein ABWY97_05435 [Thermoleophilaceae bacterium]
MSGALEELLDSLLYEGYALYPYTPGAVKNATPTPFGIVYPPAYAGGSAATHDHLRLECTLEAPAEARLHAEIHFLQSSGAGHAAVERRVELPPTPLATLAGDGVGTEFEFESEVRLSGRARIRADELEDGRTRIRVCIHNSTPSEPDWDRPTALSASLLSTHPVVITDSGRFLSGQLESVNTWPVLATDDDRTMLGAAIVLPDHPQLAPESRGSLFDGTEIEEALLLHVQALSDDERAAVEDGDPAVRAMVERAAAATPEDLVRLHGRVTLSDLSPPDGLPDLRGEPEATVEGVTFHRGDKVRLRPGADGDPFDRMLDGRVATIERILWDVDDRLHLGVTVDDDPGQDLLRETGRFLYFFPNEVEIGP